MITIVRYPAFVGRVTSTKGLLSLVKSGANAAIYRRDSSGMDGVPSFDGYEVIRYKQEPFSVYQLGGSTLVRDAGFVYPSNEAFGKDGYSYRRLDWAIARFMELEYGLKASR